MGIYTRIVQLNDRIKTRLGVGEIVRVQRTHHPFVHPTKGYRMFARPGKANRRRKLIRMGMLSIPHSKANGRYLRELLGGWRLGRCRAYFDSIFARG